MHDLCHGNYPTEYIIKRFLYICTSKDQYKNIQQSTVKAAVTPKQSSQQCYSHNPKLETMQIFINPNVYEFSYIHRMQYTSAVKNK